MRPLYISYRPTDAVVVERIVTRVLQSHGSHTVLMNPLATCPETVRLDRYIEQMIYSSESILIVIGPDWSGIDEFGRFKLSTADVPVHQEVKIALRSGRRVLVVLVNDAQMPSPDAVPDELQGIFDVPVIGLSSTNFNQELNKLVEPPSLLDYLRYFFSFDWTKRYVIPPE